MIEKNEVFLEDEKKAIVILEQYLKDVLKQMDNNLKQLTGIENSLYYEIVINSRSITKAVDKVAFDYDKDTSTIWKYYYPKIKPEIEKYKKKEEI